MLGSRGYSTNRVFHPEQLEHRWLLTIAFSSPLPISPISRPPVGTPFDMIDFDSDGDLDVATVVIGDSPLFFNSENQVRWLVNNDGEFEFSDNVFRYPHSGYSRGQPSFADIDNDGDQDLYFVDHENTTDLHYVLWAENHEGEFATTVPLGEGSERFNVRLADLDNSAFTEIIEFDSFDTNFTIRELRAGRDVRQTTIDLEERKIQSLRVADVDGDGNNDFLLDHSNSQSQTRGTLLLRNIGNFQFETIELTTNEILEGFADLDLDGDLDGFLSTGEELFWLENIGNGEWTRHVILRAEVPEVVDPEEGETHLFGGAFSGDFDLDGDPDLALEGGYGSVKYVRNDGGGEFATEWVPPIQGTDGLRGDLDGDGDLDTVQSEYDSPTLRWQENRQENRFTTHEFLAPLEAFEPQRFSPESMSVQDLDGDSDADLLFRGAGFPDAYVWHENLGAGQFSELKEFVTDMTLLADLNNDGLLDRLNWRGNDDNENANSLDWSINQNGTFETTSRLILDASLPELDFQSGSVRDMDSDNDLDVWFRGFHEGDWHSMWFANDGSGHFTAEPNFLKRDDEPPTSHNPPIDLNRDGLLDLVSYRDVANWGQLDWYANEGGGNFAERIRITDRVKWFEFGDVNGDGWTDAVVTKQPGDNVQLEWHLNSERGFSARPIRMDLGDLAIQEFHLADHDADGLWEVVTANRERGLVYYEFDPQNPSDVVPETIDADFNSVPYRFDSADFDGDGLLDLAISTNNAVHWYQNLGTVENRWARIDAVSSAIRAGDTDAAFDLDGNNVVDELDRDFLIASVLNTSKGDANLDGVVSFADFIVLSTNFGRSGTWSQGDFDGDGVVGFEDFLLLSAGFLNSM